ncbi:Uncharacterized oxidoreductase C663.09c [Linum perenne]
MKGHLLSYLLPFLLHCTFDPFMELRILSMAMKHFLSGHRIPYMTKSAVGLVRSTRSVSYSSASAESVQGGVSMVKQLLERSDKGKVVATCRNPNGSTGLLELKDKYAERLTVLPLDLTVESTIKESAESITRQYGSLDLLINASGILSIPNVLQPETTLSKLDKSSLMLAYEVNAVGPILVIKHMWPLLKAGGGRNSGKDFAVVVSLSARVGSIGDNKLGGWHSYRSSKSALNQLSKTVSVEFGRKKDPIISIVVHPGTVDTDLSKPFQKNLPKDKLFTKEFSAKKLLGIIDNTKVTDNGKFFAWDGQEIPW